MRIALESTVLELDRAGVARAVSGLRDALAARDDVELVELSHPRRAVPRVVRGLDRELRWFWLGLPRVLRDSRPDLLHLPAAVGPWRTPVPLVVTVHDVMALEHPEWFSRANALQQRLALPRLARSARRVLVPSRYTAERLLAATGIGGDRVRVAPWGVDVGFAPGPVDEAVLARHGVERPYLLAVGTLQPRKGLEELLEAVGDRRLVVVGARGWRDEAIAERLRGADALVHAAHEEGFGFPPLEAMACGTPVVAYRSSSVPEVVGDGGVLADPGELAAALERVLGDPDGWRERGLARAATFTWERCAALTVAAYHEALDG